jgi:hypothetical protein
MCWGAGEGALSRGRRIEGQRLISQETCSGTVSRNLAAFRAGWSALVQSCLFEACHQLTSEILNGVLLGRGDRKRNLVAATALSFNTSPLFPLSLPARPSNINSASFSLGQYSAVDTSGGKSRLQPYVKVIRTVQCCHSPSCHSWKTVRFEGIRFLFVSPELALIPRFGGLFAVPTSIIFVTFSEPVSLNLGIGSLRQAVNHSEKPSLHRITLWITCFPSILI